ncbi:hypothetical protein B1748_14540 [Paenibacillus sp. MY03]|uniref:DUF4367 domain-containing protein n=1 Tax=Paenibacillus sp. MY03 TaxID=302980 RepID=UPI000B3C2238|nr:DUF4367 domain-containing protein [Paenibacillus sp. MY03]OUS76027.1 hypothetical protein B1748_14540 [Paenibacillus sp. MY03]
MNDIDRRLREQFREESDNMLFNNMELSEAAKDKIRRQASPTGQKRRSFSLPKAWIAGTAVVVTAVVVFAGYPLLNGPSSVPAPQTGNTGVSQPPSDGGASSGTGTGTGLSQLITAKLATVEEAKAAFGEGLLVPSMLPEGFLLQDITTAGMEGEPLRDAVLTYAAGDRTFTYTVSRMETDFPQDMFSPVQVKGAEGFVFEQPELVELYWIENGIQYGIVGNLTADEAVQAAESIN